MTDGQDHDPQATTDDFDEAGFTPEEREEAAALARALDEGRWPEADARADDALAVAQMLRAQQEPEATTHARVDRVLAELLPGADLAADDVDSSSHAEGGAVVSLFQGRRSLAAVTVLLAAAASWVLIRAVPNTNPPAETSATATLTPMAPIDLLARRRALLSAQGDALSARADQEVGGASPASPDGRVGAPSDAVSETDRRRATLAALQLASADYRDALYDSAGRTRRAP